MSVSDAPRRLPAHPSKENLRKQAKRWAKKHKLQLAAAQFRLAGEYGFATWVALMREVEQRTEASAPSPLVQAAARGDEAAVRTLLAQGANVGGEAHDAAPPLFVACDSDAPPEGRVAVVKALLDAGAFTRGGHTKASMTPLHAAARRGPAAIVELLLSNGALFWQADAKGKKPLDYAREGAPIDRERILYLCADGPHITDPNFRDAVTAIQRGDIETLRSLLDAHPALLQERAIEPDLGARNYFSDPALFWFIANNPTLVPRSPDNIVEVAELMLARGVKQEDKDYAFGLVATNSNFVGSQQVDLVRVLAEAGAAPGDMLFSLGHWQRAPAQWLVENGYLTLTAPIAAGLGRIDALATILASASPKERTDALGIAVINHVFEAARLCLEAGADPNQFMPCHSHSTPLHQAALFNDIPTMRLLIAHGARTDIEDTLWRGRPLGWARHSKRLEAEAYLREVMAERGEVTGD